ncbi:hypothetical protein [Corynebacterium glyciniphilum]|uniref:hypothetical protein n=2 Tax=Corynebacterium glyciniphilum TaxID=1404244 RepID=UPI0026ED7EF9|nr:hypothetical protein [Corynebacterium glyciniphilum]
MMLQRRTRARSPVPSRCLAAVLAIPSLVMGLAACGAEDSGSESAATSGATDTPHGYVEGAEEATEPQLRLAAVDADSGGITLADLLTGDPMDTPAEPDGEESAVLKTSDGRFLFTTDDTAVTVTDTGVWTVDHGDHNHYYRSDASQVGTVDGDTPGHVVSNASQVAMFFDGDGAVKVFPRQGLGDGELTEDISFDVGAHHGVAVPFEDHVLTTVPGADDEELPGEISLYDGSGGEASGELTGETTCPEIHGAAGLRDHVAFACGDGVLTVDDDLTGTVTPYPRDADGRAWSLVAGRDLVAAPFEDGGLGVFDPDSGEWQVAETDAPVVSAAVAPDDSSVFAVDEDGVGYVVDADSGEVTAQRQVVDGGGDTTPSVVLTRERGYVSDPAAGTVAELDVRDNLREARSIDVGGHPAAIAVTGDK